MMTTSTRTYVIFSLGFATAFFFMLFAGPLFSRRPPERVSILREPFIPDSPHSHGEFDQAVQRQGRITARNWMDKSEHSHVGEDLLAKQLFDKVRIFCWIMTGPNNHKTKAIHVKATWAKRCNKFVFVSSVEDKSLPSINVNVAEGRDHLWGKTKAAFRYLYDHYLNDYDFFLKADDDTYVVLENLRYMLRNVLPSKPILFGRKFKQFVKQGYMSGGAGYVISRRGLRLMVDYGFGKHKRCRRDEGGAEDVHFGECAAAVGVIAGDSRDSLGRERFHPFPPDAHFRPIDKGNWLWSYNFYPLKTGPECCSDTSIAYHYISPEWMYVLEYFVYHWHPYGVVRDLSAIRHLLSLDCPRAGAGAAKSGLHAALERSHADELYEEIAKKRATAQAAEEEARKEVAEVERLRGEKKKLEVELLHLHSKVQEARKEREKEKATVKLAPTRKDVKT